MFNLILIIVLINAILNYLFKVKITTLNCGNFAWVGKVPELFNLDKYKILGLYNESRGKHACGIFVDGKIQKGIHTTAHFSDLIAKESLQSPKVVPVVIGHTRQSSVGIKSLQNTHPFKFEKEDGSYFVGSHNGTLSNHHDLATKYKIDTENRSKIDSEILLEIISKYNADKNTNIKVLSEYEGGAAIVFHDSSDPNILYVFRGKSETTSSYYGNGYNTYGNNYAKVTSEERPLFYWQESSESMYISSLRESLDVISNCDAQNIHTFQPNVLYRIDNGSITKEFKIDRINSKKYEHTYTKTTKAVAKVTNAKPVYDSNANMNKSMTARMDDLQKNSIFYENVNTIINDELTSGITYERLRFRRNGHSVIDGCYVYIDGYGLQFVDLNPVNARKQLKDFKFYDPSTKQTVELKDQSDASLILMVEGLIIPSVLEFTTLMSETSTLYGLRSNPAKMSHMSRYPVIPAYSKKELKSKRQDILINERQSFPNAIILNAKKHTGLIKPICSNKTYHVKDGLLVSTTISLNVNNVPSDIVTINLDSLYEKLDDTFEDSMDDAVSKSKVRSEINDIIEEVDDHMDDLMDLGQTLLTYSTDPVANAVFEILQDLERNYEPIKKHVNFND
jgi:predicted glutamine amidotransferase